MDKNDNIGKVCSALYKSDESLYDISMPAKIPCTITNVNNANDLLEVTSDGCIKVISDKVKALLLSGGSMTYQPGSTDTYYWTRINHYIASTGAINYVGYCLAAHKNGWASSNITPFPVKCSKGDYFYMYCISDGSFQLRGGSNTHLTAVIIESS